MHSRILLNNLNKTLNQHKKSLLIRFESTQQPAKNDSSKSSTPFENCKIKANNE